MNILNKIKIHPFTYLLLLISLMTGMFKEISIFMSIILIHELGHILMGLFFKWPINKIIILPFGALTIFEDKINKSSKEELLVTIMGPLFQIIYLLLTYKLNKYFYYYSIIILIFNLLPIIPLDGSKLINTLLNLVFSFYYSYIYTIILSLISLIILILILPKSLLIYLILIILIKDNIQAYQKKDKLLHKFLLERYMYDFKFSKEIIIYDFNVKKMHKNYRHLFFINEKYVSERFILKKKFIN